MVFIIYLCINKCLLQITHAILHEDWRCGRAAADFFKRNILKRRNALARRKKTNPAALVAFMKTPVYLRSGGDERERQTASLNVQSSKNPISNHCQCNDFDQNPIMPHHI